MKQDRNEKRTQDPAQIDWKDAFPPMPAQSYLALLYAANKNEEEKQMKKKLSVGLVLAIALVLAIGAACAIALWQDTAKDIAQMEAMEGEFYDWPAASRIKLIEMLIEKGEIERTEEMEPLLTGKLDEREAGSEAIRIMMRYLSGGSEERLIGKISLQSILSKAIGPFHEWSLEDKAWYSSLYPEATGDNPDDARDIYIVPDSEDIPMEEAEKMARDVLKKNEARLWTSADTYELNEFDLLLKKGLEDERFWEFTYISHKEGEDIFGMSTVHVHARTGEIRLDGIPEDKLATEKWMQRNKYADHPAYQAMERIEGTPYSETGKFYYLKLKEKAQWSQEVRPLVQAALLENPDMFATDPMTVSKATYIYGLPTEMDISLERAVRIARDALLFDFDIKGEILDKYTRFDYFDITDEASPRWKFYFSGIGSEWQEDNEDSISPHGYGFKVEMDARTGELINVLRHEPSEDDPYTLEEYLMWV